MNTNINSQIDRLIEANNNAEIEKCKDPVYFYENYFLVDGKKPAPLKKFEKEMMRKVNDGYSIQLKRGRMNDQFVFSKPKDTFKHFAHETRFLPAIITKQ